MYLICASQQNLLSRTTPRNFISVISLINYPFAIMDMASGWARLVNSIK